MALSVLAPAYLPGLGLSHWRRSEDFLTGEFFALIRYLPPSLGVLPALAPAWTRAGLRLGEWLGATMAGVDVQLWPWIGTSNPDVRIRLYGGEQKLLADIVVEVKLYSGPSAKKNDPDHQLTRYLKAFAAHPDAPARKALVYLTPDRVPQEDLDEARREAGDMMPLLWMSWHEVAATLFKLRQSGPPGIRAHESAVLDDLLGILRARGIRSDEELKHFPMPTEKPLDRLEEWLTSWSLGQEEQP